MLSPCPEDHQADTTRRSLAANERLATQLSTLEVMAVAARSLNRADTVASRLSRTSRSARDASAVSLSPAAELTPQYVGPSDDSNMRIDTVGLEPTEPLEHVRLDVPEEGDDEKCLPTCWGRVKSWGKGFVSRNVPVTIPAWRLGIQWAAALAIGTVPLYVKTFNSFFRGSEIFIAISAVTVFDPTIGGHVRKLLARVGANIAASAMAALIFVPLTVAGYSSLEENPWLNWLLYANAILIAFFWGYIINLYPKHQTLPFVGISASMTLYVMTTDNYLGSMWRVTVANILGVLVGSVVFRFVLPKRARLLIQSDLVQVFEKIGETLEPLVVLEAGLVHSASFFTQRPRRAGSLLRKLSRAASRRSLSRTETPAATASIEVNYEEFRQFRDDVWNRIEAIATLLNAQEPLLRPAEREYSHNRPHRFPTAEYRQMLDCCKRVFYQIVSLYLVLDTHGAVASMELPESAQAVLGEQWEYTGVVRIKREQCTERSETNHEAETVKRHFTQPTGGLSRAMRLPSDVLRDVKARFASDPTLWTFDDMGSPPVIQDCERDPSVPNATDETSAEVQSETRPTVTAASLTRQPARLSIDETTLTELDTNDPLAGTLNSLQPPSHASSVATLPLRGRFLTERPLPTPAREVTLQLPIERRLQEATVEHAMSMGLGIDKAHHHRLGDLTPASPMSPQSPGSVGEHSMLEQVLTETGLAYNMVANIPVVQWAQVYGPLIAEVARQVAGCTIELGLCLKTLCARQSAEHRMRMTEIAMERLTHQRNQWYRATENLMDSLLRGDADAHRLKVEADEMLMQTWLGMTSQQYLRLSREERESLWRSFGATQDRLAQTARILMALTAQVSQCYDAMTKFIVAMGGKVEKNIIVF